VYITCSAYIKQIELHKPEITETDIPELINSMRYIPAEVAG
jgi:hypothetical protein